MCQFLIGVLHRTVLYMARSVQISNYFSVKHEPNFLIFLLFFFLISQTKKFGGLRKYVVTSIKQLTSYELYTLLCAGFYAKLSNILICELTKSRI